MALLFFSRAGEGFTISVGAANMISSSFGSLLGMKLRVRNSERHEAQCEKQRERKEGEKEKVDAAGFGLFPVCSYSDFHILYILLVKATDLKIIDFLLLVNSHYSEKVSKICENCIFSLNIFNKRQVY
jgi:hypothetical protein